MDISFTSEQEDYRQHVKEWLRSNIPKEWLHQYHVLPESEKHAISSEWDKLLYKGGFSGISWPQAYGGQGLSLVEEIIFEEEAGKLNTPKGMAFIGKVMLGPTLLAYGTEEQKQRFLPPLLRADEIWCQGFSEPNAGSDLASLQTRAEFDGKGWIINGQKIWTSLAQFADWCFVLARTDHEAPKHKGITYFLVPMNAEGITVRPVRKLSGESDFNEIFFENVCIPEESYVGRLNDGWNVAMRTLSYERGTLALARQSRFQAEFDRLAQLCSELETSKGTKVKDDPYFRQKLAEMYAELKIMRFHGLKTISKLLNDGTIGEEASMNKLYWSEWHSRLGRLSMEILGRQASILPDKQEAGHLFQHLYLTSRGETIYAGTNQIQRNVIAERILGMPR